MSEPLYTLPTGSSTHKRSFDDLSPDSDDPTASSSRRDSVDSSASTAGDRERNKRARNDPDSSYASEVDDLLLSSNTSASSSSSGSSISSYHSAQSTLTASPILAADDNAIATDMPSLPIEPTVLSFSQELDIIMEDAMSSGSPNSLTESPSAQPNLPDSNEQFRRTLERVDVFERELASLRHSPFPPPPPPAEPAWVPWTARLPDFSNVRRDQGALLHGGNWQRVDIGYTPYTEPFMPLNAHFRPRRPERSQTFSRNVQDNTRPSHLARTRMSTALDLPYTEDTRRPFSRHERDTARPVDNWRHLAARQDQLQHSAHHVYGVHAWSPLESRRHQRNNVGPGDNLGQTAARHAQLDHLARHVLGEEAWESLPSNVEHMRNRPFSSRSGSPPGQISASRASSRPTPPLTPCLPSLLDDYWRREHDRDIREFDRTIREAQVHRQRMADFLADLPHTSGGSSLRDGSLLPALPSAPSSFSTLRGALDDTDSNSSTMRSSFNGDPYRRYPFYQPADQQRATRSHNPSVNDGDIPTRVDADPLLTLGHDTTSSLYPRGSLVSASSSAAIPVFPHAHDDMFDYHPPSHSSNFDPSSLTSTSLHHPEWYLEANRRARNYGISGLRHRARPRSPSPSIIPRPPSPPRSMNWSAPEVGARHQTGWPLPRPSPFFLEEILSTTRPLTDDPALPLLTQSSDDDTPSAPHPAPAALPEPSNRPRRYPNIDLDAYREGPFRATLARSMALQTRDTQQERHDQARVTRTQRTMEHLLNAMDADDSDSDHQIASADDLERYMRRRHRRHEHMDHPSRLQPRATASSVARPLALDASRSVPSSYGTGESRLWLDHWIRPESERRNAMSTAAETTRDGLRRTSESYRALHHTDRPIPRDPDPLVPTSTRYRTLLQRPSSGLSNELSAHTTGLERWEQRQEVLRRISSRHSMTSDPAPASSSSSAPTAAATTLPLRVPPRSVDHGSAHGVGTHTHGSSAATMATAARRSTWRPTAPLSRYATDVRTDDRSDRPPPLNGRFARPRAFPSHLPPDMVWVDPPPGGRRWRRRFGDYMRDEDIDMSYEGLLSLTTLLGDVKPRGTPPDVISSLPRATYEDWAQPGDTEERCPICLDDYKATDPCLRVPACSHWFHEACLKQWLKDARTCPVCRGRVNKPSAGAGEPPSASTSTAIAPIAGPSGSNSLSHERDEENDDDEDEDSDGDEDGGQTPRHWTPYLPPWRGH